LRPCSYARTGAGRSVRGQRGRAAPKPAPQGPTATSVAEARAAEAGAAEDAKRAADARAADDAKRLEEAKRPEEQARVETPARGGALHGRHKQLEDEIQRVEADKLRLFELTAAGNPAGAHTRGASRRRQARADRIPALPRRRSELARHRRPAPPAHVATGGSRFAETNMRS
jgi:hypothetical protein